MAKRKLTFIFVDPNRPEEVEQMLRHILLAKLLAVQEGFRRHGGS